MLVKLLKYDFKNLFQILIPLYLISLLFAFINGFAFPLMNLEDIYTSTSASLILNFFSISGILLIFSITLVTAIWCIRYTYMNIFSKEGYLTNTLPVSTHEIILSKIISCFTACIVSCVVSLFAFWIYCYYVSTLLWSIKEFEEITMLISQIPLSITATTVVLVISNLILNILLIFMSLSLGHLSRYRVVLSFVAYFAVQNIIIKPISSIILVKYTNNLGSFQNTIYSMTTLDNQAIYNLCLSYMWIIIAISLVFSVIFYFTTEKILKHKLNLL